MKDKMKTFEIILDIIIATMDLGLGITYFTMRHPGFGSIWVAQGLVWVIIAGLNASSK